MITSLLAFSLFTTAAAWVEDCSYGFKADGDAIKYVLADAQEATGAKCLDGTPGVFRSISFTSVHLCSV